MHTKRISAGYVKGRKWATTVRGPHARRESITLIDLLKNLGYADNGREARKIITEGNLLVDGRTRRDPSYGVGLMDVVSIPKVDKYYRMVASKGGLTPKEIKAGEAKTKLCRVNDKKVVSGGRTQINLHDGSNMLTDQKINVNDTVVVEVPGMKVKDIIPYAVGNHVMVAKGMHRGKTGVVKDIAGATAARKSLTTVGEFQTLTDYVFVIGKDRAVVEV